MYASFSPAPVLWTCIPLREVFFMCIINYYSFMCQGACTPELMALFFQLQNVRIFPPPPPPPCLFLSLSCGGVLRGPLCREFRAVRFPQLNLEYVRIQLCKVCAFPAARRSVSCLFSWFIEHFLFVFPILLQQNGDCGHSTFFYFIYGNTHTHTHTHTHLFCLLHKSGWT